MLRIDGAERKRDGQTSPKCFCRDCLRQRYQIHRAFICVQLTGRYESCSFIWTSACPLNIQYSVPEQSLQSSLPLVSRITG